MKASAIISPGREAEQPPALKRPKVVTAKELADLIFEINFLQERIDAVIDRLVEEDRYTQSVTNPNLPRIPFEDERGLLTRHIGCQCAALKIIEVERRPE
jgi:hypothetical protein